MLAIAADSPDDESVASVLAVIGNIGFVVALIVVAVLYRMRLRQIKRLTTVNFELNRRLAIAETRIEDMERWTQGGRHPGVPHATPYVSGSTPVPPFGPS